MPRKTRMYLPGIPAHVVQRGHNRNATFFESEDCHCYLDALSEGFRRYRVQCHAYVLMTNHVHLLLTPRREDSISRVMQHVGRVYVRFINKKYKRSGALWEGRHKASLIQSDVYLLACYRYIELNPVAAGMVSRPEDYRWSSYSLNAFGLQNALISQHEQFMALGATVDERCRGYREFVEEAVFDRDIRLFREALMKNLPVGNDRFREDIESKLGRKLGTGKPGRPSSGAQAGCNSRLVIQS